MSETVASGRCQLCGVRQSHLTSTDCPTRPIDSVRRDAERCDRSAMLLRHKRTQSWEVQHGTEISEHPRDDRQYAGGADQSSGAARREPLRQDRSLQPAGFGQGPIGSRRNRGGRKIGRAQARSDRDRGDQRKYRNWSCHGLRRQGISAGAHHGGAVQRRAAQADAVSGREGHRHARRRARRRHGQQDHRACQGPWLVHDPAV